MAGLVDHHVHVNEPGNTEWEGFETATKAAASGGVTTIVDMPLNSLPVTTSLEALNTKIESMQNKLWVDTGLLGGIVPGNADQIEPMIDRGVVGFKSFMIFSGLDAFQHVEEQDMRLAMQAINKAGNNRTVYMFHAEVDGCCSCGGDQTESLDPTKYATFLSSRPRSLENDAIAKVIELCSEYKVPCHIVHLSSSDAIEQIQKAKSQDIPITAETTFHYLHFASESIPDSKPVYKCCPPIREEENREKLWSALKSNVITQVISDHSPCPPFMKELESGNIMKAWGGISGVGLGLPVIWTNARKRGFNLQDITKWMSLQTAKLVNLDKMGKGSLKVGNDADLVIWDPEGTFTLKSEQLHVKHKLSPYVGETFYGVVYETILRGNTIFCDGEFPKGEAQGKWLKPE